MIAALLSLTFISSVPLNPDITQTQTHNILQLGLSIDNISLVCDGGSYIKDSFASRLDYILDEKQINYGAAKLEFVIKSYLAESKIYLSIIPDKNYFLADGALYPRIDYDKLTALVRSGVPEALYIDLFGSLSIDDYYRTDAHWDQRFILPITQKFADTMKLGVSLTPGNGFTVKDYSPFNGLYTRRYPLPLLPDTLYWLTSTATDAATMTGIGFDGTVGIYTEEKLTGLDPYDIFAAGPQAILTIESPASKTDRELIIFRDSFGSSLAPLLLEGYAKITLVDLRYIPAVLLAKYIDFHGQDVLFLYSTTLLNSAMVMK